MMANSPAPQPLPSMGPANPVTLAPVRKPQAPSQPQDMLTTLYQQLKQAYPHIPDADLLEGARRMLTKLQQQQSEEFYQQLFPERNAQPAPPPAPGPATYPTPAVQKQMVAPEQAAFAAQQAKRAARPGQAQPIQPPPQGTPYGAGSRYRPVAPKRDAQGNIDPTAQSDNALQFLRQMNATDPNTWSADQWADYEAAGRDSGVADLGGFYRDRDGSIRRGTQTGPRQAAIA